MDSVKKKVSAIRANIVSKTEKFNYALFLQVIQELEPDLQFEDDRKLELFENLSEGNDGYVPRIEIEKLLQIIEKRERRISAEYINEFSLDKLSELKQIYQSCDRKGAGAIHISQIENFLSQIHNSAGSKEEILYFFRAVAEISTETIAMKLFSKVLSELEKRLYDQLTCGGPLDDTSIDVEGIDVQMNLDSGMNSSITGMNLEGDTESQVESRSSLGRSSVMDESNFSQIYAKIQIMNARIEEIISLNIKDPGVKKPLFAAHDQLQGLKVEVNSYLKVQCANNSTTKFKQTEKRVESMENEIEMLKSKIELQKARMEALEYEVKREHENQEKILEAADILNEENANLRKELQRLEITSKQIDEKNRQLVLLESQCNNYIQANKRIEQQLQETIAEKEIVIKNIQKLEEIVQINVREDAEKERESIQAENEKTDGTNDDSQLRNEIRELKKQLELVKWEKESKGAELENAILKANALNARINELIEENRYKEGVIQNLKLEMAKANPQSNDVDISRSMIITPKHRPTLDREIGFLNTHDTTLLKETPIGNNDQSPPINEGNPNIQVDLLDDSKKPTTSNFLDDNAFKTETIPEKSQVDLPVEKNEDNLQYPEKIDSDKDKEGEWAVEVTHVLDATCLKHTQIDNEFEMNIEAKILDPVLPHSASFRVEDRVGRSSTTTLSRPSRKEVLSKTMATSQNVETKPKDKETRNKKIIENAYLWSMNKSFNMAKSFGPRPDSKMFKTLKMDTSVIYQEGMFARDYLSLRTNPQVVRLMSQFGDSTDICYSDYVIRINAAEKKEKRIIFVTGSALYNLRPAKFELIRRIELRKISKLTLPEMSAVHLVIHVKNEYDYLLEVYRRANLVLFLMETFRRKNIPEFTLTYEIRELFIHNRKSNATKKLNQYDKATIQPEMQEAYRNAAKLGFLYLHTDSWFFTWKQFFFVMIDIGIMYFTGPGQKKPSGFIPILGAKIFEIKYAEREHCFKIVYKDSATEFLLSAASDTEAKEWIETVKQVQEQAIKKAKHDGTYIEKMQKKMML